MHLDLFKLIDKLKEEDLHPKFKLLRDDIMLKNEREVLLEWTDGFIDRDNKIIKEFQTTFHSSFWEFFLFSLLSKLGLKVDFTHDRPDFIIKSPKKIFIEAVVSNIKQEGRKEFTRGADDVFSMIVPPHKQSDFYKVLDESIIRHSNAIQGKSKKYLNQYRKCDWVDTETPFLIALSAYDQISYGREYIYSMLALLYGYYFHPIIDEFELKETVLKLDTNSTIPIGLFNSPEFSHISAIIYSCTTTLGKLTSLFLSSQACDEKKTIKRVINIRNNYEFPYYVIHKISKDNPEYLDDGIFIFHNPKAKNKLDKTIFDNSNIIQFLMNDDHFEIQGNSLPIYSRLSADSILLNDFILQSIFHDFND